MIARGEVHPGKIHNINVGIVAAVAENSMITAVHVQCQLHLDFSPDTVRGSLYKGGLHRRKHAKIGKTRGTMQGQTTVRSALQEQRFAVLGTGYVR